MMAAGSVCGCAASAPQSSLRIAVRQHTSMQTRQGAPVGKELESETERSRVDYQHRAGVCTNPVLFAWLLGQLLGRWDWTGREDRCERGKWAAQSGLRVCMSRF